MDSVKHTAPVSPRPLPLRVAALFLVFVCVGCEGRGNVSGKVTYNNKVLQFGQVMFEGKDGGTRQGSIGKDGSYAVQDLAVGDAKVAVNSPNPKSIIIVVKGDKKAEPYPPVPGWFAIPPKYETMENSGLSYTIKKGENTFDINLK